MAAKVRPALVLGCDIADEDRVLVAVVYHTTALRGSRYEIPMRVPGLDGGGFDAQSLYTVPAVKLIRRRAALNPVQMKAVDEKVHWLPTGTLLRLKCLVIPRVFGPTAENDVKNYPAGVC
jgi:mRNA interferase MazF